MRKLQWKGQNIFRLLVLRENNFYSDQGWVGMTFRSTKKRREWKILKRRHTRPCLGSGFFWKVRTCKCFSTAHSWWTILISVPHLYCCCWRNGQGEANRADDENFRLSANKRKPNHPHQPSWQTLQFLFHKRCSSHCGIKSKTTNYPVCDCCHTLRCFWSFLLKFSWSQKAY